MPRLWEGIGDWWPPRNPWAQRGSVGWDDLAQFLRRNAYPHAQLRINYYHNLFHDIATLMNWHYPQMAVRIGEWRPDKGETQGHSHLEAEAVSVVCNIAWLGGECPLDSIVGVLAKDQWGNDTTRVLRKPVRGVREATRIALDRMSVRPTVEVGLLLNDWDMVRRCWQDEQ